MKHGDLGVRTAVSETFVEVSLLGLLLLFNYHTTTLCARPYPYTLKSKIRLRASIMHEMGLVQIIRVYAVPW